MQKKIIALAIAGLASSAAFAQSNVTIYGRLDYGFETRSTNSGAYQAANGTKSEFGAGLEAGSRIGFKGAEDLGNGTKAIFEAEFGLGNDQTAAAASAATWTNRHSYVGLTGGWGTAVGGRVDGSRYSMFNEYDAFQGGGMGNITQLSFQVDRGNNAIAYITPTFGGGFSAVMAYTTSLVAPEAAAVGAASANTGDIRLWLIKPSYKNGPISVTFNYEAFKSKDDNVFDGSTYALAGSYDFKAVKVSAMYDTFKNKMTAAPVDFKDWFLSAAVPLTPAFDLKATYGQVKHSGSEGGVSVCGSDCQSKKFGLGVDYKLSKRTNFYADYGKITNGQYTGFASAAGSKGVAISPAANSQAALTGGVAGYGTSGFDIGIAHNF